MRDLAVVADRARRRREQPVLEPSAGSGAAESRRGRRQKLGCASAKPLSMDDSEPLRQRAPLEGEVKGEIEAEAGMPREDDRIQRLDVDHFNDEFLTDVIRAVTRRLQARPRKSRVS